MPCHYLLVVSPLGKPTGGYFPSRIVAEARLSAKVWPLYARTTFLNIIAAGDCCLIYAAGAGPNSQLFVGKTNVHSVKQVRANWVEPLGVNATKFASKLLHLENVTIWRDPVAIKPLVTNLRFIKNKVYWGQALQGGCKRLSVEDFELICDAVSSARFDSSQSGAT